MNGLAMSGRAAGLPTRALRAILSGRAAGLPTRALRAILSGRVVAQA